MGAGHPFPGQLSHRVLEPCRARGGETMMMVSVVIPTRNRRLFLPETVSSVLEQSYSDWELIIVDDASTDDTQAWLGSLHDRRIHSMRHANRLGQAAANNT